MKSDDMPMTDLTDQKAARLRNAIDRAGKVAGKTATVTKKAAGDGLRIGAEAVGNVRERLDRAPGEPNWQAALDRSEPALVDGDVQIGPAVAILASQALLADYLASRQSDEERRKKMERALETQKAALVGVGVSALEQAPSAVASYVTPLPAEEQVAFFVDLYFLDPFAPYTLKTTKGLRREALDRLAAIADAPDDLVERIHTTKRAAAQTHTKRSLGKVGFVGVGAAMLLGVAGLMAAPIVGTAIGVGAGLTGAAATAHGLAILGGGALAAGGAGMAGGMWVVAGAGAAAGLFAGGGGVALYELGSATARGELVKLQITFKLGLLDANRDMAKAQEVIKGLVAQADSTRELLAEERTLNDENSKRLKDLEETLADIEQAIGWMESERDAAETVS